MAILSLPFTLLLASILSFNGRPATAAPTDPDIALAKQFAPQFKFHKDEIYWPSTVEFFLKGVRVVDDSGNVVAGSVDSQTLDDTPNQGSGLYLNTDINAGKAEGGFLRGQNPANSAPDVNTFVVRKANGVTDIYYWLFTPFNSAKSVPVLGQVGDHVGDWERITVRTVNGAPTQVNYNAHSNAGSGTIPWDQAPRFDNNNRPVAYIAYGSHGTWASAGTFTYVNAVIFKLQDETSEGGVAWDTRDSVKTLVYPDTYTGSTEWLNFKGAWGNKGTTNCWWYIFYNNCELVTGPTGPLRPDVLGAAKTTLLAGGNGRISTSLRDSMKAVMDGPLDQTLGTTSTSATSSYTIRLTPSIKLAASAGSIENPKIAVQQTCVLKNETDSNQDVITTTVGTADLVESGAVTLTPAACSQGFVTLYTIGFCAASDSASENCSWASSSRVLRAFHANAAVDGFGVQDTAAIVVDDLDDWEW